jgi:hypothetical protein
VLTRTYHGYPHVSLTRFGPDGKRRWGFDACGLSQVVLDERGDVWGTGYDDCDVYFEHKGGPYAMKVTEGGRVVRLRELPRAPDELVLRPDGSLVGLQLRFWNELRWGDSLVPASCGGNICQGSALVSLDAEGAPGWARSLPVELDVGSPVLGKDGDALLIVRPPGVLEGSCTQVLRYGADGTPRELRPLASPTCGAGSNQVRQLALAVTPEGRLVLVGSFRGHVSIGGRSSSTPDQAGFLLQVEP